MEDNPIGGVKILRLMGRGRLIHLFCQAGEFGISPPQQKRDKRG